MANFARTDVWTGPAAMDDFSREISNYLGGCRSSRIFLAGLSALSMFSGVDFTSRYEDEIEELIHVGVPQAWAEQFSRDVAVSGICQALIELAAGDLSEPSRDCVRHVARVYLERIRSPWDASLGKLARSPDPRIQEQLQAIREYSGQDLANPPGHRSQWHVPSSAGDQREHDEFEKNPLQVPPHADLIDMTAYISTRSKGGSQHSHLPYRGTLTTVVEHIGSNWMFREPPDAADLPFQLATSLDALGIHPLGTLAKSITEQLLDMRRAEMFGDLDEDVECDSCGESIEEYSVDSILQAMEAGTWECPKCRTPRA